MGDRPPKRKGKGTYRCRRCGRVGRGVIRKYGLHLCRQCFREVAPLMGWRKYQ